MRRYHIDNETEPVREIQTYLLEVAYADDRIPKVTIDGHYGDTTRDAVKAFQETEGITETGIVDSRSVRFVPAVVIQNCIVVRRHSAAQTARTEGSAFPFTSDFDLHLGETGIAVIVLQALLAELASVYPNVVRPAITGQFGLTTADAVRSIQRNYGLRADGTVSVGLWNRMVRDYESKRKVEEASGNTP